MGIDLENYAALKTKAIMKLVNFMQSTCNPQAIRALGGGS
jgi:hypothetical protein